MTHSVTSSGILGEKVETTTFRFAGSMVLAIDVI